MRFETLSDELVGVFIDKLKNGLVWRNGLMGSITSRYVNSSFEREMQDVREPDVGPFISTYTDL